MVTAGEAFVIVAMSTLGALAQAAITLHWYEPPERDGETPTPIFEAGLFFVVFGALFYVLGIVLSALSGLAPPVGTIAMLLFTAVGLALAYATVTERAKQTRTTAQRFMGAVFGVGLAVLAVLLLVV